VNSRPLLREFVSAKNSLSNLRGRKIIQAYLSGRFDGDGSIDKNLRSDCRIVYGKKEEAKVDKGFLEEIGVKNVKIYYYKSAKTFCLYISRYEVDKFLKAISSYSKKIQKLVFVPRRDLTLAKAKRV